MNATISSAFVLLLLAVSLDTILGQYVYNTSVFDPSIRFYETMCDPTGTFALAVGVNESMTDSSNGIFVMYSSHDTGNTWKQIEYTKLCVGVNIYCESLDPAPYFNDTFILSVTEIYISGVMNVTIYKYNVTSLKFTYIQHILSSLNVTTSSYDDYYSSASDGYRLTLTNQSFYFTALSASTNGQYIITTLFDKAEIYRSQDYGSSFSYKQIPCTEGFSTTQSDYSGQYAMSLCDDNSGTTYLSTNYGKSYASTGFIYDSPSAISGNGAYFYIYSYETYPNSLYQSTDHGSTWNIILTFQICCANEITADYTGQHVFLGFEKSSSNLYSATVYYSSNYGASFKPIFTTSALSTNYLSVYPYPSKDSSIVYISFNNTVVKGTSSSVNINITFPTFSPTIAPTIITRSPTVSPTLKRVNPTSQPTRQPSVQPSRQPSNQPTRQPSRRPSSQPSRQPTRQPSSQPISMPTRQPSGQPSVRPTAQPSTPTGQPTSKPSTPTSYPSAQPVGRPSTQPSGQPSRKPNANPTSQPSRQPSRQPSSQPSRQPSSQPTRQPSSQPSTPSSQPSRQPTQQPTRQPFSHPSRQPSTSPTSQPSRQPSSQPTNPTSQPSSQPTNVPFVRPTGQPSGQPSCRPSQPTGQPTGRPSHQPISSPSMQPSSQPTRNPTQQPTSQPSSAPTKIPDCPAGTRYAFTSNSYECIPCAAGYFSTAKSSSCTACPAGTYQSLNSSSSCIACPVNTYSSATGFVGPCHACSGGYINGGAGSTSQSECINPLSNFIFGYVALFFCFSMIFYFTGSRLRKNAFLRYERLVKPCIITFQILDKRIEYVLSRAVEISQERQRKRANEMSARLAWIKRISFIVIYIVVLFLVVIISLIYVLGSVLFKSMIIWRGYEKLFNLQPLYNAINSFIDLCSFSINLPLIDYIFYPAVIIISELSNININLSSVNVTCSGVQAPIRMAVNLLVAAFIVVVIESNIAIFWFASLQKTCKKFVGLSLNRFFFTQGKFLPSCRVPSFIFGASLLSFIVPSPIKLVQYAIGFVSLNFVFDQDGHPQISANCDSSSLDSVAAYGTVIIFGILILPVVYLFALLLVPSFDVHQPKLRTLSDSSLKMIASPLSKTSRAIGSIVSLDWYYINIAVNFAKKLTKLLTDTSETITNELQDEDESPSFPPTPWFFPTFIWNMTTTDEEMIRKQRAREKDMWHQKEGEFPTFQLFAYKQSKRFLGYFGGVIALFILPMFTGPSDEEKECTKDFSCWMKVIAIFLRICVGYVLAAGIVAILAVLVVCNIIIVIIKAFLDGLRRVFQIYELEELKTTRETNSWDKEVWTHVLGNYWVFLFASLGIWTNGVEEEYDICRKYDLNYIELSQNYEKDNGYETSIDEESKKSRYSTKTRKEFDKKQEFQNFMFGTIGPRVVLIQLLPYATILSIFAIDFASSPICVLNKNIRSRLPPLLISYKAAHDQAYHELLENSEVSLSDSGVQSVIPKWKVAGYALYIILMQSRLIQFFIKVFYNVVALYLVFGVSDSEDIILRRLIIALILITIVIGLIRAIYAIILLDNLAFPESDKKQVESNSASENANIELQAVDKSPIQGVLDAKNSDFVDEIPEESRGE